MGLEPINNKKETTPIQELTATTITKSGVKSEILLPDQENKKEFSLVLQKMDELEINQVTVRLLELEKIVGILANNVKTLILAIKEQEELLVYGITTIEEALNQVSNEEMNASSPNGEREDVEAEQEELESAWDSHKKVNSNTNWN